MLCFKNLAIPLKSSLFEKQTSLQLKSLLDLQKETLTYILLFYVVFLIYIIAKVPGCGLVLVLYCIALMLIAVGISNSERKVKKSF